MKLMTFLKTSYVPSKLTGKSQRTVANHKTTVRGFTAWFRAEHGRKPQVADLSRASLDGYKQHLVTTGRKHSTVNKVMANLSALWRWAYLEEIHSQAPRKIERLPEVKRDPTAWTLDEMRRILLVSPFARAA